MPAMATGTVKWFNNAKGYGFVIPAAGGGDVFVHYSCIQMDGYRTLCAGQQIAFDVEDGPKGLHAVNVRVQACPQRAAAARPRSGLEAA